jgi:hypothetical protein
VVLHVLGWCLSVYDYFKDALEPLLEEVGYVSHM